MANIVVALDYSDPNAALLLAQKLQNHGLWMKVGMELFTAAGPDMIKALKDMGYPVFLDLKFHDIPNTVKGAMHSAAKLGVDIATIHISGGEEMVKAAIIGAKEGRQSTGEVLILGVTVLTSLGQSELAVELATFSANKCENTAANNMLEGIDPKQIVINRAKNAKGWGLKGVVSSAREVADIKTACGSDFICLTPGIRLPGGDVGDQKRVTTPADAVRLGANYLVIGRAITDAKQPLAALEEIMKNIAQG